MHCIILLSLSFTFPASLCFPYWRPNTNKKTGWTGDAMNSNKPARLCMGRSQSLLCQFSRKKPQVLQRNKCYLFKHCLDLEANISKGYSFSLVVHFWTWIGLQTCWAHTVILIKPSCITRGLLFEQSKGCPHSIYRVSLWERDWLRRLCSLLCNHTSAKIPMKAGLENLTNQET